MALRYDPAKALRLAEKLYTSAVIIELISVLAAIAIIVAAYLVPKMPRYAGHIDIGESALLTIGVVTGVLIMLLGKSSGGHRRLQAQLLMCQWQIERNTAHIAARSNEESPVP